MFKKTPEDIRKYALRYRYGITSEIYKDMFDKQNGLCAICGAEKYDKLGRNLAVDHDHKSGAIRGLLCYRCNILIGHYSEDTMMKAISYMQEYKII